jgi:hypothetical protein
MEAIHTFETSKATRRTTVSHPRKPETSTVQSFSLQICHLIRDNNVSRVGNYSRNIGHNTSTEIHTGPNSFCSQTFNPTHFTLFTSRKHLCIKIYIIIFKIVNSQLCWGLNFKDYRGQISFPFVISSNAFTTVLCTEVSSV